MVWVVIIGSPVVLGAAVRHPGRRLGSLSTTVGLMFASAALVDLSHGVTEAHFHFFVMLGVVALYQDWSAFGVCILITVLHHAVMGTMDPHSVYGGMDEWQHPVQWALIHGGFILAASITHLIAWKANEQQELSDPLTRLANRTGALNLDVIAEGVELRRQQDILTDLGCRSSQGYLHSRPLTATDFASFASDSVVAIPAGRLFALGSAGRPADWLCKGLQLRMT